MIRPALLVHTVTRQPYVADDFIGDTWGPAEVIRGVRVEPAQQIQVSGRAAGAPDLAYKALLFAAPDAADWQAKDKVIFNGTEMTVQAVNDFYASGATPHHVEVQLI
ncbi:putative minor capsid protein [Peptococcus simiae]|uniref:putative minor capsid protein n=1 Tax=Peptococcus simiae TaxID=1643805 RepID=UPI00397F1CDF